MNNLFCTPEQGQRLKELLPDLNSTYYWVRFNEDIAWDIFHDGRSTQKCEHVPALTLQELRDVAMSHDMKEFTSPQIFLWNDGVLFMTAPEFAAWVIERLEEAR